MDSVDKLLVISKQLENDLLLVKEKSILLESNHKSEVKEALRVSKEHYEKNLNLLIEKNKELERNLNFLQYKVEELNSENTRLKYLLNNSANSRRGFW